MSVCADGEWDFDNYSIVVLGQRKELPVTCLAAVNYNVWCGTGNYVHVVGGSSLKMEASGAELGVYSVDRWNNAILAREQCVPYDAPQTVKVMRVTTRVQ